MPSVLRSFVMLRALSTRNDEPERASAPDLVNAEVFHTIRRLEQRNEIDDGRSAEALHDLTVLPIARYPTIVLLERAWTLRHSFSAYDALYLALAEALRTKLVTADARLAKAIRGHAAVDVVLIV